MNDLPDITILTPVFERNEFLNIYLSNIAAQDYPKEKIKVLIHECKSNNPFIQDIDIIRRNIAPIELTYCIDNSGRKTIGQKRNWLVKHCETDYFMFFDSDDVYLPTALNHSVQGLINSKLLYVLLLLSLQNINSNLKTHLKVNVKIYLIM